MRTRPLACERLRRQVGSGKRLQAIELHRNMRVHVVESVVEILELVGEHKRPFQAMLERRAARRCVLLHQVGAGDGAIRQPSIASHKSPPDLSFRRMKATIVFRLSG